VKGFLIGRPLAGQEDSMGLDHIHAVSDLLEVYQVPILFDVDIGHLPPMMPLITGSLATVSSDLSAGTMQLSMKLK
jgi:muramoyltetrapeptide carboxypeptidase LdcA involved in peptidoglycan recycling